MGAQAPVTVIIRASRARALYLHRCVCSIRDQKLRPEAVVIVAQGSSNEIIGSACEELAHIGIEVRMIEGRDSLPAALNHGVQHVRSEWMAILDDDDTWDSEFIAALYASARSSSVEHAAWVASTSIVYEIERGDHLETICVAPFNPPPLDLSGPSLAQANRFTIHAALWRTEYLRALGGFRDELPVLEDWDLNVRAAERFTLASIPRYLAFYHRRPPWTSGANTSTSEHNRIAAKLREEWTHRGLLPERARHPFPACLRIVEQLRAARGRWMDSLRWRLRLFRHGLRT